MATLLLVTDEAIVRKSIQMGLEQQGHKVLFAKSLKEVMAGSYDVDCVISEHWLPDGSGIDLISHFKPTPLILLSRASIATGRYHRDAQRAFDCFHKTRRPPRSVPRYRKSISKRSHRQRRRHDWRKRCNA